MNINKNDISTLIRKEEPLDILICRNIKRIYSEIVKFFLTVLINCKQH